MRASGQRRTGFLTESWSLYRVRGRRSTSRSGNSSTPSPLRRRVNSDLRPTPTVRGIRVRGTRRSQPRDTRRLSDHVASRIFAGAERGGVVYQKNGRRHSTPEWTEMGLPKCSAPAGDIDEASSVEPTRSVKRNVAPIVSSDTTTLPPKRPVLVNVCAKRNLIGPPAPAPVNLDGHPSI